MWGNVTNIMRPECYGMMVGRTVSQTPQMIPETLPLSQVQKFMNLSALWEPSFGLEARIDIKERTKQTIT